MFKLNFTCVNTLEILPIKYIANNESHISSQMCCRQGKGYRGNVQEGFLHDHVNRGRIVTQFLHWILHGFDVLI